MNDIPDRVQQLITILRSGNASRADLNEAQRLLGGEAPRSDLFLAWATANIKMRTKGGH